jgi:hypothetical protein
VESRDASNNCPLTRRLVVLLKIVLSACYSRFSQETASVNLFMANCVRSDSDLVLVLSSPEVTLGLTRKVGRALGAEALRSSFDLVRYVSRGRGVV